MNLRRDLHNFSQGDQLKLLDGAGDDFKAIFKIAKLGRCLKQRRVVGGVKGYELLSFDKGVLAELHLGGVCLSNPTLIFLLQVKSSRFK